MKDQILKLAFDLEKVYPELNFKHHCYLRIAYDVVTGNKWNIKIKSPFLDNSEEEDLMSVINLLILYKNNKHLLLTHNNVSLYYRTLK